MRALAEYILAGLVVERVVAQLEGEARLAPELGQLAPLAARYTTEDRTGFAGRRQQHGALALDHREVVRLGHGRVEAVLELQQLALRHRADRVREDPEDVQVAVLDDHRRSAGVEEISAENRPPVAPDRVGRGTPAPQLRQIHHVVMQQRRRVEQLDRRRHLHAARAAVATELGAEQHQHRADALAARAHHVVAELAHQVARRAELLAHGALHQIEARRDALDHLVEPIRCRRRMRHGG